MASTKFWYLLLDSATTGQLHKGSTADFVLLPPGSVVAEFQKLVHSKNPNKLARVDASDLLVYKNKAAFDMRNAEDDDDEGKEISGWPWRNRRQCSHCCSPITENLQSDHH
jgi:hypothetical protein